MNIIFVSKGLNRSGKLHIGRRQFMAIASVAMLVIPGLLVYAGYRLGVSDQPAEIRAQLEAQMNNSRETVTRAVQEAQENMTAFSQRLGQMQAHVIRLDALGQRLTKMAKLDKGEFDFERTPAQGGPTPSSDSKPVEVPDFVDSLTVLEKQIGDRVAQLNVLESMLMNRNLQEEIYPAGRPIKGGWISSYFGWRADPFNGRREHHDGMDFAGKAGSSVVAAAAGVVTWSGERYGYGNLVEINHGNGYVTRYGHNKEIVVKVGDTVKKGQTLSYMGSTGRSTGPHVHFEVLRNGRTVDPAKYIQASR